MENQITSGQAAVAGISEEDKNWAMGAHLMAFVSCIIPFANFIGPIVIMMTRGKESSFVSHHAKEFLNMQISLALLAICLVPVALVPLLFLKVSTLFLIPAGFIFLVIAGIGIASLVFPIIAAIRAREGKAYQYPYILRLVK